MKTEYPETKQINNLISKAKNIVVVQADNPDTDSLGSALSLEQILSDLGKSVDLYCAVKIPLYLQYIEGWDRVVTDFPRKFDLSIIVDTSASTLLENLNKSEAFNWIKNKPVIVIDHHPVDSTIAYATVVCNHPACATGEVIFEISKSLGWPLNLLAKNALVSSIMADSQGLTTDATTARSIAIVSELVEDGVKIAELESKRRDFMRKKPDIVHYKGELLKRVEYFNDNRVAVITIPWIEIEKYSHDYNPSMLVLDDMRLTTNTDVAIAFKLYKEGRITAKIKCNYGKGIANQLAQQFGGGGHPYISGFKLTDGRSIDEVKKDCIDKAIALLDNLPGEKHEII